MRRKVRSRVLLTFICFIFGTMLGFSYQHTKEEEPRRQWSDSEWKKEYEYRSALIALQKENRSLKQQLVKKQAELTEWEKKLAEQQSNEVGLAKEAEQLRMHVGKARVKGKGVAVTLSDSSYIPSEASATDYIVHEQHVWKVVHELLISGAEAVAINGQRISHRSYIVCNGPVIEVDGTQHAAPFVISAIGDPDVLSSALELAGGVVDQLVEDHIDVKVEKQKNIVLDPVFAPKP
ncbi:MULTISPECIES: DUF881 domain-containing protein [Geobacillus]|jgi:uncharacterized protein YlxW (UPF0749 family)|uniref:DUF881 domain-containing protein n=1 Tax=Geobacillus TaxID=129337 RepID=UPI0004A2DB20|nr:MULTISPECIES: DUF881 domain-containing protein [Geobacillus]ARA97243.1 hypothetical protein GD3902_03775 [Geobacillus thermodenitrificans]ATO36539.1 hypothetical protein GTID1_04475 [Geobacillus thermodenitrificans]NNU85734.1 DUF881 domain-containing protein [Geobacillus sp. MR]OQP10409.1 hypothetical protein B1691_06145 [Geobacillus sp. 47C-IIb]QNU30787.1 DUF881 domain-containing protein [Geobacillus sp. 47C-IIb]